MADLRPMPLGALVRRALAEARTRDAIFDLPSRKWYRGRPALDLSARLHDVPVSTPLGPAAGPHTQLAQNIALGWLAGGRVFELKTVQVLDTLTIPRPCIDATNVGYNVEWSQELRIDESIDEYVKAAMLLQILRASGVVAEAWTPRPDLAFDLSVGYDLEGIRSPPVTRFLRTMRDAHAVIARLRDQELTGDLAPLRALHFPAELSRSVTLSTFHGCPAGEIEAIAEHLLREHDLDVVIKLNPTLLGYDALTDLLRGRLGYTEIRPVRDAFAEDLQWDQALAMFGRLVAVAASLGRRLGAKFTNTLVVENHRPFFPRSEARMYMSGAPLHPIALSLALRFREAAGPDMPISFSAGIDAQNFPAAVASGLMPITVCTDLLRPGGYGRLPRYLENLEADMTRRGARTLDEYVLRVGEARGTRDPAGRVRETGLSTLRAVVAETLEDPRYHRDRNAAVPRKLGSRLVLFDCLTCDKCVPVCPNDANFTFVAAAPPLPVVSLVVEATGEVALHRGEATMTLARQEQLANYADLCNECGNCDVFCPEDGGPYVEKPRFFGSLESFEAGKHHGSFYVERADGVARVWAHLAGSDYRAELVDDGPMHFSDGTLGVVLDPATGEVTRTAVLRAEARGHALSTLPALVISAVVRGALDPTRPNPVNAPLLPAEPPPVPPAPPVTEPR